MTFGVDVSKDTLAICDPTGTVHTVANTRSGVSKFLKQVDPNCTIAMEATGRYHMLIADAAFARGFRVIVFNPKDVLHYAKSISPRAKTDTVDARVIAKYADARPDYRLYQPVSPEVLRLRDMVRSRTLLVRDRIGLENRLRDCPGSAAYLQAALDGISASILAIDKEMEALAASFEEYGLLLGIPGVGPVTAAYLLSTLASGEFRSSDSFVAYLGLDVRVRQSGMMTGRSALSKRGDPEGRRLLYLSARAVCRHAGPFSDLYARYCENGMSKIASCVAVSRKIARTAWSVYGKKQHYSANRVLTQGASA